MPEHDGQGKSDRVSGDSPRDSSGDGEELGLRSSEADIIGQSDGEHGDRQPEKPDTVKKSYYVSSDNAQWVKDEAARRLSNESRVVDAILDNARSKVDSKDDEEE